ncbi:DNA translocase FtsK [Macrococcus equi]|uniref:DNA translocase FtsK n=1 Tax=Macrococcus equi TaxID=3395462 RepID=UPI0039BDCDE0
MSWFDKLFGESMDKSVQHQQEPKQTQDDVYRRPRGKFRFPLNVDNIKTAEDHVQIRQNDQEQRVEQSAHKMYGQSNDQEINTEDIRTSFETDYVPRRERRRGRQSAPDYNRKESKPDVTYERYQPKTRIDNTSSYRSYTPKTTVEKSSKHNTSFTQKQYNVHQPKFKASEVPSAIYGTKPRKDPAKLKMPEKVQPIQGEKSETFRPATPTYRKEDNTVNIENVYASQIVAEIRREREKKLQRKKEFELEREQLKQQQEAIASLMNEKDSDEDYLDDTAGHTDNTRVTIIEEEIPHEPAIQPIDITTTDDNDEVALETDAEDKSVVDEVENISLVDGERYTYSTKTPFNQPVERLSIIEAADTVRDEDVIEIVELDDEMTEDHDDLKNDELHEDTTENLSDIATADDNNKTPEETSDEAFLDENVTFDSVDEPVLEVETIDDTIEEVFEAETLDNAVVQKSLEPTLMPDINTQKIEAVSDYEPTTETVSSESDITESSLEPVLPLIETEEITEDEVNNIDAAEVKDISEDNTVDDNNDIPQGHYVQVENNELKANIRDFKPDTLPKKKVSPFNVVMTPSDKRRLLDKKKRAEIKPQDNIDQTVSESSQSISNVSISQDIQQSFEQGAVNSEQVTPDQPSEPQNEQELKQTEVKKKEPSKRIGPKYLLPPVSLLNPEDKQERDETWVEEHKSQLNDAFYHFNVPAKVENVVVGPSVTRFELSVEKGVKVSRITNLQDDIKMALAAKDIRIEAPIPGTSLVGVEVPNVETRNVNLSEVLFSKKMKFAESKLTVALGARINNEPMIMDLAKMPHGLIAGATGSGKSVCINSILVSLLYRNNPNELKLLLIDPKMVELAPYNDLPHLIAPVITDVKAATESLKWVVEEMERRYKIFADIHVRNITAYNQKVSYVERLPKIVIVIDELADLMMMSPQDVEHSIARIAQKARAAGMHMILATQRPSVNVITGLIKANVPTRIAFMVSSAVDSRTIIDSGGAEKLLGNGDMLYLGNGMNKPIRIQGNYVSDEEIDAVVQYVKTQGEANYLFQEQELLKKVSEAPKDELFDEICNFMIDEGHISTSQIQRRFQIGYNRAARIIDQLEDMGYVSGQNGSKPRTVLITEKQADY